MAAGLPSLAKNAQTIHQALRDYDVANWVRVRAESPHLQTAPNPSQAAYKGLAAQIDRMLHYLIDTLNEKSAKADALYLRQAVQEGNETAIAEAEKLQTECNQERQRIIRDLADYISFCEGSNAQPEYHRPEYIARVQAISAQYFT